MSSAEIVNKVWNYAHVLRDEDVGCGDYVEQLQTALNEFRSVEEILTINDD
jgi:hypothetical protein